MLLKVTQNVLRVLASRFAFSLPEDSIVAIEVKVSNALKNAVVVCGVNLFLHLEPRLASHVEDLPRLEVKPHEVLRELLVEASTQHTRQLDGSL
ncbi:hypothetical protein D3C86_1600470 [compost metagenome]